MAEGRTDAEPALCGCLALGVGDVVREAPLGVDVVVAADAVGAVDAPGDASRRVPASTFHPAAVERPPRTKGGVYRRFDLVSA